MGAPAVAETQPPPVAPRPLPSTPNLPSVRTASPAPEGVQYTDRAGVDGGVASPLPPPQQQQQAAAVVLDTPVSATTPAPQEVTFKWSTGNPRDGEGSGMGDDTVGDADLRAAEADRQAAQARAQAASALALKAASKILATKAKRRT